MTEKQRKNMTKIFNRSGRTFQSLAAEAGINNIPDHLVDLSDEDLDYLIKCFSHYLK